jgi:general L-amino acid transport system permease protein
VTSSRHRPPFWRDVRVLAWAFQAAVAVIVVAGLLWLFGNVRTNSEQLNIPTGYAYLDQPASFPIPGSSFRPTQPVSDALMEGLLNTVRVAAAGLVLATIFGVLIGVARLSGNFILQNAARVFVEIVRNVPLLGLLTLAYVAIALAVLPQIQDAIELGPLGVFSNRGSAVPWFTGNGWVLTLVVLVAGIVGWQVARWRHRVADRSGAPARSGLWALGAAALVVAAGWLAGGYSISTPELDGRTVSGGISMSPEFFAVLFALVVYTSSHIAEIVRGSIQAVDRGQGEAANALALSGFQRMWFIVLPQAMRIAIPPLGNQYLNLTKNSSLGAVISYFEVTKVTRTSIANSAPAVPSFMLLLGLYLMLSLIISLFVNLANRSVAVVER